MKKAVNIWAQAYDSARKVMPIEAALARANAVLLERMGIEVSLFDGGDNQVVVKLLLPNGCALLKRFVGYITPTLQRRFTIQTLESLLPKLMSVDPQGEKPW